MTRNRKGSNSGCGTVIAVFLFLGLIVLYVVGVIIAIDILSFVMFVIAVGTYLKSKGISASTMMCNNCGSYNVKLSTQKAGTTANAYYHKGLYNRTSTIRYRRIANCQDCGFSWVYITGEDVANEHRRARNNVIVWGVVFAICAFFSVWLFINYDGEDKKSELSGPVWKDGYTDISDFDYYIDGEELFLTGFDSKEKMVRINSSYEIDGNIYFVVALDGAFTLNSVTSVIVPEGVRSIARNEFNSCGIKFLYLPSTLQDVGDDYFWNYFHDVEKIYYGGSEEQWKQLCTVERSGIDVKQIIYDANQDDLKQ